jgi:hypothetical protein
MPIYIFLINIFLGSPINNKYLADIMQQSIIPLHTDTSMCSGDLCRFDSFQLKEFLKTWQ